jgi:hypothetical protein
MFRKSSVKSDMSVSRYFRYVIVFRCFGGTLTEHELVQHIRSATHVCGHILDVVITREDSLILFETPLVITRIIQMKVQIAC